MDLFADQHRARRTQALPLAVRMRPRTLDDFVGQTSFLEPGKLLRRLLEADRLCSAVFCGPPGTGKTSLATVIARWTKAHFVQINAIAAGVKDIRAILDEARARLETTGRRTILFVDELHRFNRTQQEVLLNDVEDGIVILIGATTENPFFTVSSPLLSRSQIFQFEPLSVAQIREILVRALRDSEHGLGSLNVHVTDEALDHWAITSDGDARRALTALEVAVRSEAGRTAVEGRLVVDLTAAEASIQRKAQRYDRSGDAHFDSISAMIKSIRGSDPDAAVYWLAHMLEGGEDPRYVARRIVIAAAEDVGNADPMGLVLAQAAADATHLIGLPECRFPLAQAAIYLACAPKSNASAQAVQQALRDVRSGRTIPVPKHLQSSNYAGARRLGAGEGYRLPHDSPDGIVPQEYLGVPKVYYTPTDRGAEAQIGEYLQRAREIMKESEDPEGL